MSSKRLTTTQQALLKIQKELTTYYTQKIFEYTKPNPFLMAEFKKQHSYFQKIKTRKITSEQLQVMLDAHPIILVGDYHPFKPSQNEFFDLVRAMHARGTPCVVVLESLLSTEQKEIQDFLEGHITSGEFLEEVRFDRYWGFPTYSTEKMMHFCRREKIPLYGMNLSRTAKTQKHKTLFKDREAHFCKILAETQRAHPQSKVFVLVGNLHLMPHNLASQWKNGNDPTSILHIHQDIDEIYWRQAATLPHIHRECFAVDDHRAIILNSHPWIKYHSYWSQIEQSIEYDQVSREESLEELLLDQHEQFVHLFHKVGDVLGLTLPVPEFSVYGPLDLSLPLMIRKSKHLSSREKDFYEFRFKSETAFYIAEEEILFCPQMSMNIMIDCVTQLVATARYQWHYHFRGRLADFYSWLIFEAHLFFMAKLMNSTRKAPSFTKLFEGKAKHLFGKNFQPALESVLGSTSQSYWKPVESMFYALAPDKKYALVRWLGRNWGTCWFNHHIELGNEKILEFFPPKNPHDLATAQKHFHHLLKQIPFELTQSTPLASAPEL